jgi:hypothetical protein
MRILVACEFSGIVRNAFRARGHDAWSCDLLPAEDDNRYHMQKSVLKVLDCLDDKWDMMIAHPPCTHLAVSGARWFKGKAQEQEEALLFVRALLEAPIPRIALENPVSIISTRIRKQDQTFQPHQFWAGEYGKGEVKRTCLWLKNLPKLIPTTPNEPGRHPACWLMGPSPDRWKARSRTYPGVAAAMAKQWGGNDKRPTLVRPMKEGIIWAGRLR